jgi:hypothetical protein
MMLTFSPLRAASELKSVAKAASGAIAVVYPSSTACEIMSSLIPVIELAMILVGYIFGCVIKLRL